MTEEISSAITLLQTAQSLPAEQQVKPVKEAAQLLLQALKDNQGNDPDVGGGG